MPRLLAAALMVLAACGPVDLDAALRRAARDGNAAKAKSLIARGARVDAADEDGWTPLLWAAAHGDREVVGVLLDAGANPGAVTTEKRQDALTLAAQWNRAEVVSYLIRRGASVNRRDTIGWTPLMWASLKGRTPVVAALLDGGAPIETLDAAGNTPLILAARQGRADTVKLLLARGARRGARDADGDSAAELAASAGYPEIAAAISAR